ncbi:hypothetical protein BLOT_009264 [Blomia tropicalis]|nr:hypothetical protein BLOT_009264 [Blomia tropicalis]
MKVDSTTKGSIRSKTNKQNFNFNNIIKSGSRFVVKVKFAKAAPKSPKIKFKQILKNDDLDNDESTQIEKRNQYC